MKYLLLVIFGIIFIMSSSTDLNKILVNYKFSTNNLLSSDKYRFGDLYGFSYLKEYKLKDNSSLKKIPKINSTDTINNNLNLYIIGDSYMITFLNEKSYYFGVKNFESFRHNLGTKGSFNLEEAGRNILLIESVETGIMDFKDTNYLYENIVFSNRVSNENRGIKESSIKLNAPFNPKIEENLTFNIFDSRIFTPVRELRATINDNVFHKIDDQVMRSPDNKYLLYRPTADSTMNRSVFSPVGDKELDNLIASLNNMYVHYRNIGMDEVYLALIPRTVSVLYPEMGRYNDLIKRIQNHPNLKMPVLNIYDKFKNEKRQIFRISDTHWNRLGCNLWLEEFNEVLKKESHSIKN